MAELDDTKSQIEQFKIKKLMRWLRDSKGAGTSMITLMIPPKKQITDITNKLIEEFSKASNIKDRVNRQSVETAITSTRERLKLYNRTPNNGLILFCGHILEEDGKTLRKVLIDFEPFKPINTSKYYCDNKFHVEDLGCLLENDMPFGFLVIDGNGSLFATLQGNSREILYKFQVELPKKHRKGGQSSVRFARLRLEKRHNYLTKVAEKCVECFIENDRPNVRGIIFAGSADFKSELYDSQMLDPRLKEIVIKLIDTSYGGENGLYQAIELAKDSLLNVKFVQEKETISKFFEEIKLDTGKYVYGVADTMRALETGIIEKLLVYEDLDYYRIKLKNKETEKLSYEYKKQENISKEETFKDKETGADLETVEVQLLTEWMAENYNQFGCDMMFITDKSPEGFQFAKGFSGVGGFLRFKFEVDQLNAGQDKGQDDDEEDDFI